jgi:hypothetical protein
VTFHRIPAPRPVMGLPAHDNSEQILWNVRIYVSGSFESGTWFSTGPRSKCVSRLSQLKDSQSRLRTFRSVRNNLVPHPKRDLDQPGTIRQMLNQMEFLFKDEDPMLLEDLFIYIMVVVFVLDEEFTKQYFERCTPWLANT